MSDQLDRFPPPSNQPVAPAGEGSNKDRTLADVKGDEGKAEHDKATGDQVGGQSSHSEDEIADRDVADATGEDEGSSANEGQDDHLKDEQKPTSN